MDYLNMANRLAAIEGGQSLIDLITLADRLLNGWEAAVEEGNLTLGNFQGEQVVALDLTESQATFHEKWDASRLMEFTKRRLAQKMETRARSMKKILDREMKKAVPRCGEGDYRGRRCRDLQARAEDLREDLPSAGPYKVDGETLQSEEIAEALE